MANHILAVHVGTDTVALAIARSTLRSVRIQLLASLDAANPAVSDLVSSRRWDQVVATVPATLAAFRVLELPFTDRRRIAHAVGPALEADVPLSLDECAVAWDYAGPGREGSILAAMAPREQLRAHVRSLESLGLQPSRLVWEPSAVLPAYVHVAGPAATCTAIDLSTDNAVVACFEDGRLTGLRTASYVDDDTTIRHVGWFVRTLEPPRRTLIGGARADVLLPALREALPGMDLETLPEDCPIDIHPSAAGAWRAATHVVGLVMAAAGDSTTPRIVFSPDVDRPPQQQVALRTAARELAPWAAVAVGLFGLATGLDTWRLTARQERLEATARQIYRSVMPDEPTTGYRLKMLARASELETRMRETAGAGPAASPLDVLADLSEAIPPSLHIEFEQLAYDPPSVRLRGHAENFETVTQLERALRDAGRFAGVEISGVRAAVGGGADFDLTVTIGNTGRTA